MSARTRTIVITLPAHRYWALLDRLVADPVAFHLVLEGLVGQQPGEIPEELKAALVTHGAPELEGVNTEMTQLRVLSLLRQAVSYILTGSPQLEKFNIAEVEMAWKLLLSQKEEFRGTPYERPLYQARNCLCRVFSRLDGGRGIWQLSPQERAELEQAAGIIDGLIMQTDSEPIIVVDEFWQTYSTDDVISGIDDILSISAGNQGDEQ